MTGWFLPCLPLERLQDYERDVVSNPSNRKDELWWWVDSCRRYSDPHQDHGIWVID